MYLDPGFGSMLIQLLVAGFAVLGGFFVAFRKKLKNHFKKGQVEENEDILEAEDETSQTPDAAKPIEANMQNRENNRHGDI